MTQVLIKLDQNKMPIIERFEGQLKVGSKTITYDALFKTILNEAPLELVFDVLANKRTNELEVFFENIIDCEDSGYDFLLTLLSYISDYIMNLNSLKMSEIVSIIIKRVESEQLPLEHLTPIINNWLENVQKVPVSSQLISCYIKILKYFLNKEDDNLKESKDELLKVIYEYSKGLKGKEKIDNWVAAHIKHLPHSALMEALQEREDEHKKVIFGFSSVPRNASYIATTNEGITYFYDIPKTKIRVKYHDVAFDNVGHPRLLFAISTNTKGTIISLKLAALKGKEPLTIFTPLYKYPYSNVYSDGRVCWTGYHDLPIDQIPLMFLSTSNNGHLNNKTLELFKQYQEKPFDETELIPMNMTIEDWC